MALFTLKKQRSNQEMKKEKKKGVGIGEKWERRAGRLRKGMNGGNCEKGERAPRRREERVGE